MSKINKNSIINTFVFALGILGIMAFTVIATVLAFSPKEAEAYDKVIGYYNSYGDDSNDVSNDDNSTPSVGTPFINSISPNGFSAGGNARVITVRGSNFNKNSVVRWDGFSRNTTYINSKELEVELNKNDVYSAGDYSITVYNAGAGVSNTATLTVNKVPVASRSTTVKKTSTSTKTSTTNNTTNNGQVEGAGVSDDANVSSLASNAFFGSNTFMPSGIIQWMFLAIFILLAVIAVRSMGGKAKYDAQPMKHA